MRHIRSRSRNKPLEPDGTAGSHWTGSGGAFEAPGRSPLLQKPQARKLEPRQQALIDDADEVPVQVVIDALAAIEVGIAILIGVGCVATVLLGLILWRVW